MIQTIKVLEKSNFHLYIKDFLFKQAIKNIRSTAPEVQPSDCSLFKLGNKHLASTENIFNSL